MNKTDWMNHHGLTMEEMDELEAWIKGFNGKVVAVVDNPTRKCLRSQPPAYYDRYDREEL